MPVVSSYTSIDGADLADGDDFLVVDVSDTTQAVTGTTKRITAAELGVVPGSLSRLFAANAASITGIASSVQTFMAFDTPTVLVGTDLEVDAMDSTKINVKTDGVYTVTAYVIGGAASADMEFYQSTLLAGTYAVDRYFATSGDALDDTLSWTGFLSASDTIQCSLAIDTLAGTWSIIAGNILVQRVV